MTGIVLAVARKNRKVQALALLLAVSVAAAVVHYVVVCRPVAGEVAGLRERLASLEADNSRAQDSINKFEAFMDSREKLDEFKSMLASRLEYTRILKDVYDLAKRDGMQSSSFGAQTVTLPQASGLERMSFSLPVSGSYVNVRKFIYDVESSDLFLNIDSLALARGTGEGEISLSIGLSTYVRS